MSQPKQIKKTWREIDTAFSGTVQILNQLNVVVARAKAKEKNNTADESGKTATKTNVALSKIFSKIHAHLKTKHEEFVDKCDDIRLQYASVDDKENVLYGEKGEYLMTKENTTKAKNAIKALGNESVFVDTLTIETDEEVDFDFLEGIVYTVAPKKAR